MRINIIGSGVVGTATGKGLLDKGHEVTFYDISTWRRWELKQMGLEVTTSISSDADISMICVPTPGRLDGHMDLSHIKQAVEEVAKHLGSHYQVIVIRSTVMPSVTEGILLPLIEQHSGRKADIDFGLCHQPDFLRLENENNPYQDFLHPRLIVIGAHDSRAGDVLEELYKPFPAPILRVDIKTAETIRCIHNLFNATKVSFFNEMHLIEERLGIDSNVVHKAVTLTAEGIWNPEYGTKSGYPYGGSCLPKDTEAFLAFAEQNGWRMELLNAVININDTMIMKQLQKSELASYPRQYQPSHRNPRLQ